MSEYKELIEILRDDEYCGKLDFVYDSADAIEQLVAECNRLQSVYDEIDKAHHDTFLMYCKMKHERDAAVADLKEYCDCDVCKNNNDECLNNVLCKKCSVGKSTRNYWEWRGVQDECRADLGVRE